MVFVLHHQRRARLFLRLHNVGVFECVFRLNALDLVVVRIDDVSVRHDHAPPGVSALIFLA